jgi:hypothetical protein
MFTAKILGIAEAAVTYPLVACSYPHVSLQGWTDYVARCARGDVAERVVGMVDARGRYHAVFAYRVGPAKAAFPPLQVSQIATFRLAGNAIQRAVQDTQDRLARENNCRDVIVSPWALSDPGGSIPANLAGGVLSMAPASDPARRLN